MATLDTNKYLDAVCLMVREGQKNVPVPIKGVSMRPEPVTADQLRAKVEFVRIGTLACHPGSFRWWFFAVPWLRLAPWRPQIARLLALFRKKQEKPAP